jgi:TonB family protein
LDEPVDFVREEVAAALRRDIPVIPVLVRGAEMPHADQLPDSIKELAYRNSAELTHARWKSDVQLLLDPLRRLIGSSGEVTTAGADSGHSNQVANSAREPQAVRGKDSTTSRFDAATLQRVTRALASDIGPIADVVVKRAALTCSTTEDLYRRVAEEIESPQQRERFLHAIGSAAPKEAAPRASESTVETIAPKPRSQSATAPVAPATRRKSQSKWMILAATVGVVLLAALLFGKRLLGPSGRSSSQDTPSSQSNDEARSTPDMKAVNEPAAAGSPTTRQVVHDPETTPQTIGRVPLAAEAAQNLVITKVVPTYPMLARQAHIQGAVVLQADISKDGSVESLRAISGHPLLIPSAIDSVKQWKYKPYLLNGEPVPVQTQITVNFTLS